MTTNGKRAYGTGSLFAHSGKWYGKWRIGERQVKRSIGRKRKPGTREGITRRQAEAKLRKLIEETCFAPPEDRLTVEDAGSRYVHHVEHVLERKPSTVQDYKLVLRKHLAPFFGAKAIDRIGPDDVAAYMHAKIGSGLSAKTVGNQLTFLHGVFRYAVKRGWAPTNPVAAVDRPKQQGIDPDIRYLTTDELEAVIRKVPDDALGKIERVLYRVAAMTGLRQGELVALRWRDVDWVAGVVRVRRTFTRGKWGTPKSKRSSRAVPMADRIARELELHFQRSEFQGDDDLVFCHPQTGNPYDPSKMRERFKDAVKAAKVRAVRFHDLRHTFGTQMAAAGAPLRALQEWMGHRDYKTTELYADYAPDPSQGAKWAEAAFGDASDDSDTESREAEDNSGQPAPH